VRRLPLFWKMVLGFLFVLFLPFFLFELSHALDSRLRSRREIPPGMPRLVEWSVERLAGEIRRAREERGEAALGPILAEASAGSGLELHLFLRGPGGTRWLPSPPPDEVEAAIRGGRGDEGDPPGPLHVPGHRLVFRVPLAPRGAPLAPGTPEERLVAILPPPPGGGPGFLPEPLRMLMLPSIVGIGLCFLLVRWLTVPIRDLREVTVRLGRGDFSARAGAAVTDRGDEIADLARAFNGMAERIEALMASQRRLLGDISHELRSPLQRLDVAAALARGCCTPEGWAYLDRIERETERMDEMIGQLLELTREELREDRPEEEFDLSDLLRRIAADAEFEGAPEGKRVLLTVVPGLRLRGSPSLLASALENGVRNALCHTAPGTAVEIRVREEGERVRVSIRDRGPGLPEAELEQIFRPFYRSGFARDRKTGGVGLGLAIAEAAVRRHGGTIRARNDPEGGLVLEIEVPRRRD